jgi:hypothetical protein
LAANGSFSTRRVVQTATRLLVPTFLIASACCPAGASAQEHCAVSIDFLTEVAEALRGEVVALRVHVSRLSQKKDTTTDAINTELVSRYRALLAEAEGFERNLADQINQLKAAGNVPAALSVCRVQPKGDVR